jgi:hypothetical protein
MDDLDEPRIDELPRDFGHRGLAEPQLAGDLDARNGRFADEPKNRGPIEIPN